MKSVIGKQLLYCSVRITDMNRWKFLMVLEAGGGSVSNKLSNLVAIRGEIGISHYIVCKLT